MKALLLIPEDQRTINRASNNGVPVVLEDPKSRVSRSLISLAEKIMAEAPK
jgi:MinD-like ATPase involved in chromosome partitioning or flagellar assembly